MYCGQSTGAPDEQQPLGILHVARYAALTTLLGECSVAVAARAPEEAIIASTPRTEEAESLAQTDSLATAGDGVS